MQQQQQQQQQQMKHTEGYYNTNTAILTVMFLIHM
jgi:hypothetical protein